MWLQVAVWPEKFTTPTTSNLQTHSLPFLMHTTCPTSSLHVWTITILLLLLSCLPPICKAFVSA